MSLVRINNTGIREGERILGIGKQCKGSIIQVVGGFYPPCRIFLDNTLLIRDRFPTYEFYSNMSHENIIQYISNSGIDNKDLYMEDVSNLVVKFEVLSGEFFSKYPDICNILISYGPINIRDAYNMFPKNPGSRARKHTLVFRPTNWTLIEGKKKDYNTCIDVMAGITTNKDPTHVVDGIGYYIGTGTSLITGRHKMKEMLWYPPSLLKSVIQKIIRVRPVNVVFPGEIKYPALHVLHSAITCLLEHPGSFVPNIQKFVKGSESCFKRLAVSIVEDSSIVNSHSIYVLLVNALLLQREPSYIPSYESISLLYSCSEEALLNPYAYIGNSLKGIGEGSVGFNCTSTINAGGSVYQCDLSWFPISSNVLESIGSFESDVRMFREYIGCSGGYNIEHDMNIWHAIDHHCYTDIAWFCDMDSYGDYPSLFHDIWELSSKYNPRRGHTTTLPFNEAQRECYLFHMPKESINNVNAVTGYILRISYVLHEDFIHSLIGTIYHGNYIITRLGMGIARKPKRDNPSYAKIPITTDEENIIYEYIYDELRKGIRRTMPGYGEILITCDEDNNIVLVCSNIKYTWNELRRITLYLKEGEDIMPNYKELVEEIRGLDPSIRKRLIMYCSTWRDRIELHRIGRDGKGTKYAVSRLDSYVFKILMKMSKTFPGCISIEEGNIIITNNVMFWYVRDKFLLDNKHNIYEGFTYDTDIHDTRELYCYQRECVDKLIISKTHGSILWIDVGMGKTLIVLTYLKYLIDNGQMTRYCCYTLPPSALDSIVREIELSGIPHNVLDMRKNGKNNMLLPNCINILYHDHLRLGTIAEQLRAISDDLILIVDEFHLCLSSNTIRTSLTLEIAKLSHRFIAMSGTILNSVDAIDDMIEWLELTVPYPLHKNNYQVAISDLISYETNLEGISIIKEYVEVPMTDTNYKRYVPQSIGGIGDRLHLQEALRSCYDIILPRMAEYAKKYIITSPKPLFIVVHNKEQQDRMEQYLSGYSIFKIGMNSTITLKKNDTTTIQFIITTMNYNAGYTLTKCNTMLTSVYPSNEASRTQIEGRLYRLGQTEDVNVVTFHTGILSYMLEKYKKTGNMNKVLKELSSM